MRKAIALFAVLIANTSYAQTFDCSAYSNIADQLACQSPAAWQQKETYEKTLIQLQRANPQATALIRQVDSQKKQELFDLCRDTKCVYDWYSKQTAAIQNGTWAPQQQQSTSQVAQQTEVSAPQSVPRFETKPEREIEGSSEPEIQPEQNRPQAIQRTQVEEQALQERQLQEHKKYHLEGALTPKEKAQSKSTHEGVLPAPAGASTRSTAENPKPRPKSNSNEKTGGTMGFFSIFFIILIGLPLSYPIWKIIVWLDKYMISSSERWHRPAAQIIVPQILGSIATGLFIGFVIVASFHSGINSLFGS